MANINIIYALFFSNETFHREAWVKEHFEIFNFFKEAIKIIFYFPNKFNYEFAFQFPFLVFLPFLYFFSLISKRRIIYKIFISLIILKIFVYFVNTDYFIKLIAHLKLPKTFSYTYYYTYFIFFYCLILILILNQIIPQIDPSKSFFPLQFPLLPYHLTVLPLLNS
jgi:hypothetical protein